LFNIFYIEKQKDIFIITIDINKLSKVSFLFEIHKTTQTIQLGKNKMKKYLII